ncbi:MAG: hypothetical protein IKP40_01550 [Clostridia bacterium]|nr:hypothetical protein [Clostridia bacterium]
MDHFTEQVVVKRQRVLDEIAYYVSWVILVVAGLIGMMYLSACFSAFAAGQFDIFTLVFALLNVGIAVGLFFFHDRLRTEYEYTFTNGSLDFAQVFNNAKRKSLGSLNVRTVEAFGPVNGSSFQRYISMPGIQQSRWFLNRDANLYYFYFQKDSNRKIIIFEPNEELLDMVRQYVPRSVQQE